MNAGLNPEIRLKRIIKPKKLKSFLQKALPLLPEGSVLCVYIDGTPIFVLNLSAILLKKPS